MKAAAELSLWMKTGRMDWAAQREERQDNKQLCKHSAIYNNDRGGSE